jgi:heptosyltransferase-3
MHTVVVYRLGSLGDMVVSLPCIHAARRVYHSSRFVLLSNIPVANNAASVDSIFGQDVFFDSFIEYPIGTRSPNLLANLRRRLLATGSDTIVYLMPQRSQISALRDLLFLKACGFRNIIGFPQTRDQRTVRKDPSTGDLESEANRLARCCQSLGPIDFTDPCNWTLKITKSETSKATKLLEELACVSYLTIHMGGKMLQKDWGLDNWLLLMRIISSDYQNLGLLIIGAGIDSVRADEVLKAWRGPGINACGRLSPRESAAAISKSVLFIGHDSGPLHLSACMQVPTLGIFGDHNRPRQWHPIGDSVTIIHDTRGISKISVTQVLSVATMFLSTWMMIFSNGTF